MVSVTSTSRYIASASRDHPRYKSRSSMYIRGLIPRIFAELAEAVPIAISRVEIFSRFYFTLYKTAMPDKSKIKTSKIPI